MSLPREIAPLREIAPHREIAPLITAPFDEFFIGWLPVPRGYLRLLRWCLLSLLVVAGLAAWLLPSRQQSPGTGQWETNRIGTLDGRAIAEPYPMLLVPPAWPGESTRTVLLVEEGKLGAADRVRQYANQGIRVRGTILHRDDRWMLELLPGDDALEPIDLASSLPDEEELGRVTLRGEFIDPKCYLGAMKPGGGKTHRGCAALCLRGGIPPMFVTRDAANRETFYLVTSAEGAAICEPILPYLGEPVAVTGTLAHRGDQLILRLDPSSIRRG